MSKNKLGLGVHVISEGSRKRELIEISDGGKGKRVSRTFHQKRVGGEWVNSAKSKTK